MADSLFGQLKAVTVGFVLGCRRYDVALRAAWSSTDAS